MPVEKLSTQTIGPAENMFCTWTLGSPGSNIPRTGREELVDDVHADVLAGAGDVLDLGLPHRLLVVEFAQGLEIARGQHLEEVEHQLLVGVRGGDGHFSPLASSLGAGMFGIAPPWCSTTRP